MKVRYLDLATGKTAENSGIHKYHLTVGNWSCDCNRQLAFDGLEVDVCQCRRYIVIGVEPEPVDEPFDAAEVIKEANLEYYQRLQK